MTFLQLNITSFNTSCDDLSYHQMENYYDGIFLQETNQNNCRTLENFEHWKVNMHALFKNKTLGYGTRTFLPNAIKNDCMLLSCHVHVSEWMYIL